MSSGSVYLSSIIFRSESCPERPERFHKGKYQDCTHRQREARQEPAYTVGSTPQYNIGSSSYQKVPQQKPGNDSLRGRCISSGLEAVTHSFQCSVQPVKIDDGNSATQRKTQSNRRSKPYPHRRKAAQSQAQHHEQQQPEDSPGKSLAAFRFGCHAGRRFGQSLKSSESAVRMK